MPLRLPTDATVGVKQALKELDDKIVHISQLKSGLTRSDLDTILKDIKADIVSLKKQATRSNLPTQLAIDNPPGPYGSTKELILREDGKWTYQNVKETTNIRFTEAVRRFQLDGHFTALGAVASSALFTGNLTAEGSLALKVPFCRVTHSAAQSTTSGSDFTLAFDTDTKNNYSMHSTATNTSRITFNQSGVAIIGGSVRFTANATGVRILYIYLNGATKLDERIHMTASGTNTTRIGIATAYPVVAGDYVELVANQTSGGPLDLDSAAPTFPQFWALLCPLTLP